MGGIELQLSCGVRIELVVGSLLIQGSLEIQLFGRRGFNPPWARGKIPEKWDIPSLDLRVQGPHNQTKPIYG